MQKMASPIVPAMPAFDANGRARLLLAANVGEEGEGNLSGMRYLARQSALAPRIRAYLVLDGPSLDHITWQALASRRFEIIFSGPGGHSWSDYGNANPVHALSHAISWFTERCLDASSNGANGPRSSFNFASRRADAHARLLMGRVINIVIIGLGVATILDTVGVPLTTFVTVLGVAGLGISLAMQDVLKSFVAGTFLLFERPFRIGDEISVKDQRGVVAQRLVRVVCDSCGTVIQPPEEIVAQAAAGAIAPDIPRRQFRQGPGCEACAGTGYRGRTGLYELMSLSDTLRAKIVDRAPLAELRAIAAAQGLESLRSAGWAKACAGITTLEEVLRVTRDEAVT